MKTPTKKEQKVISKQLFKRVFRYAVKYYPTVEYYDMVSNLGLDKAMDYIYKSYIKKYK